MRPGQEPDYFMEYYNYSTPVAALPIVVGAQLVQVLEISNDADFQGKYITITVLQADVVVANYGGTIQIHDTGVDRNLFNVPIPVDALRGDGQLPYPLFPPRLFRRNSALEITWTTNVVTATEIALTIHGAKLRPKV